MAAASPLRSPRAARVMIAIALMALLFGVFRVILYQSVTHQLKLLSQAIPGCTGLGYAKLTIPYFGFQCRLKDAALFFDGNDQTIVAQSVRIHRFRPGRPFPRMLDAALTGVTVATDHPLVAPLKETLQAMDYHVLAGDIQMRWMRRGEELEEWQADFNLHCSGAGEMDLSLQLDQVNAQGVTLALANPVNWLLVMPAVRLVAARCRYKDQGFFHRAIAEASRRQGRQPEVVQEALQRYFRRQVQSEKDVKVQAVWRSLEAFSRAPGRIALRTNLDEPVPLGQLWWLQQPRDIIQRLSLESIAEPR